LGQVLRIALVLFFFLILVLRTASVFRILKKSDEAIIRVSGSHRILSHRFSGTVLTSRFSQIMIIYIYTLLFLVFFCLVSYNQRFF
jgi:hypothetical protein